MAAANTSSNITHFSNVAVGVSGGSSTLTLNGVGQGAAAAKTVAAATTLTAADSGKTIVMDAAGGATITLPTLADGVSFRFVVGAAFATTNWIVASAEGDNINGNINVNNTLIQAIGEDQINFVATAENLGDYVDIVADSGNSQWLVFGVGFAAGSITATDPA